MNSDTRTYVVNLLENCQERQRKIALLHYELEHPAHISETEMIRTMALGHQGQQWQRASGGPCFR